MEETWETCVQSLGLEDPLEEGMATHSSILAWRIPGTEEPVPGGYSPQGRKESDTTEMTACMQSVSLVSGLLYLHFLLFANSLKTFSEYL